MTRLIFVLALLLAPVAMAHEGHEHVNNCPPDCIPETPEHDKWWCGAKTLKTDCEAKDKVTCEWADNLCKPKGN